MQIVYRSATRSCRSAIMPSHLPPIRSKARPVRPCASNLNTELVRAGLAWVVSAIREAGSGATGVGRRGSYSQAWAVGGCIASAAVEWRQAERRDADLPRKTSSRAKMAEPLWCHSKALIDRAVASARVTGRNPGPASGSADDDAVRDSCAFSPAPARLAHVLATPRTPAGLWPPRRLRKGSGACRYRSFREPDLSGINDV